MSCDKGGIHICKLANGDLRGHANSDFTNLETSKFKNPHITVLPLPGIEQYSYLLTWEN